MPRNKGVLLHGRRLCIYLSCLLACLTERMDQIVGLEPGPSRRGTFDILYSCVSTLVICVWTTIHMDVGPEDETFWQHLSKKAGWTLFTIMFPEYMLFKAVTLFIQARDAVCRVNKYYARNLGQERTSILIWTVPDGFFSRMRGFTFGGDVVDDQRIVELMEKREIIQVRSHAREIQDRSKADGFAKLVACTKASWLAIQCIARKAEGLPMSLLELSTIAYVLLSLLIYGFLWYAPRDAATQIPILPNSASYTNYSSAPLDSRPAPAIGTASHSVSVSQEELAASYPPRVSAAEAGLGRDTQLDPELPDGSEHSTIILFHRFRALVKRPSAARHASGKSRIEDQQTLLGMGCAAWGVLHCLAWHFFFPSTVEKWLWRICSILSTVGPWAYFEELTKAARAQRKDWDGDAWFGALVAVIAVTIRLILLIEMFISLRRMPSAVYDNVRWMYFIPNF